jgi:hypothetical protein
MKKHYRKEAKRFLALPRGTTNSMIETLVGDIGNIVEASITICEYKK